MERPHLYISVDPSRNTWEWFIGIDRDGDTKPYTNIRYVNIIIGMDRILKKIICGPRESSHEGWYINIDRYLRIPHI